MTWMLKLYPRAWRERYGAELEELVDARPRSVRLFFDLLGGAIDAHWRPQALARRMESAGPARDGGSNLLTRMRGCCARERAGTREAMLGAALTIGSALVLAGIMFVWNGPRGQAVALTMFPGVLVVGMQPLYLRGRSALAKTLIVGGMFLALFCIGLAAAFLL